MNWFKWVICWWNRRHVCTIFFNREHRTVWRCVRCGYETDIPPRRGNPYETEEDRKEVTA